jgi:hypothetical protein
MNVLLAASFGMIAVLTILTMAIIIRYRICFYKSYIFSLIGTRRKNIGSTPGIDRWRA